MATGNCGHRVWAAAFALGLALAGPQTVGVAAADRGDAGGSAAASGEDEGSLPGGVGEVRLASPGPDEAGTDEAGPDEAGPDEAGPDEAGPDEAGTDEAGTDEAGTDEAGPDEAGTDEAGPDEAGTDEAGTDEAGTDEAGTDEVGTEEPGTDEVGTEEPGTEEPGTEEPGTDEAGTEEPGTDQAALVEKVGEGPEPLQPELLPWWPTNSLTGESGEGLLTEPVPVDSAGSTDGLEPLRYYDTPAVDAGWAEENATNPVATNLPPMVTSTNTTYVDTQAIDSLKVQVFKALDQIAELLSTLPASPISDFLSGSLLLLRRALQPETLVRPDTDPGTSLDDPETASTSDLIGLTEDDAVQAAEAAGLVSRVVSRDGMQFPITKDYLLSRVNLTVNDGMVTAVYVG